MLLVVFPGQSDVIFPGQPDVVFSLAVSGSTVVPCALVVSGQQQCIWQLHAEYSSRVGESENDLFVLRIENVAKLFLQ